MMSVVDTSVVPKELSVHSPTTSYLHETQCRLLPDIDRNGEGSHGGHGDSIASASADIHMTVAIDYRNGSHYLKASRTTSKVKPFLIAKTWHEALM